MNQPHHHFRLWTLQSNKSVQEIEETGQLLVKWDRYAPTDFFKAPYQWMSKKMLEKGVNCHEYAPIWSWHSCGGFEKAPNLVTARALLSDLEIEHGIKTIEMIVPSDQVILSKYTTWNSLLFNFSMDKEGELMAETLALDLFSIDPAFIGEFESIQATLPILKKEWIVEIRPLNLKPNDFTYDEEEKI